MPRRTGLEYLLWTVLLWTILDMDAAAQPHAAAQRHFVLRAETAQVKVLAPGAAHTYRIESTTPGTWSVDVRQFGIDVTVTVSAPDGSALIAVDSPFDREGQELAVFESATAGPYQVVIRSREARGTAGRYEIRLQHLQAPRRRQAATASSEGGRLYLEGTPESWKRALSANRRAFELWRELGEGQAAARALYSNAVLLRLLNENPQALKLGQQILPLWQQGDDALFTANTWNEIGLNHWHLGEIPQARLHFNRALTGHQQANHAWGVAVVSANLCLMDLVEGDLKDGAKCYEDVVPLLDAVRALDGAITAATNAGRAYDLLGEPRRALASYHKALQLSRTIEDPRKEARALNNLGVLHREMGEFQDALAVFDQALETFRRLEDRRWQASVLNNLGVVYDYLGQPDSGRRYFEQALVLWTALEKPRGVATTLRNLGSLHRRLGDTRQAREYFVNSLGHWRAAGDRREEALALTYLGRSAMDFEDWPNALELLEEGASVLGESGDRLHQAETLIDLAKIDHVQGRFPQARKRLSTALELARALESATVEARALGVLAQNHRLEGDVITAFRHAETAIDLIESHRSAIGPPALRASFGRTFHYLYKLAMDLKLDHDDIEGALEISERARGRALLQLLRESGVDRYAGSDPDLVDRRRTLLQRLNAKTARARNLKTPSSRRNTLAEEQATILRQLDIVEAELRQQRPPHGHHESVSPNEIRAMIDRETVLLVFTLGEDRSLVWQVDSERVSMHELAPRHSIEAAARRVYEGLRHHDPAARSREAEARVDLARLLLAPLSIPKETTRLAIVPDGALFYTPFEALPLPTAKGPTLLLERYEVVYLPSLSVLASQRRAAAENTRRPQGIAILADPVFERDDARLGLPAQDSSSLPGASSGIATGRTREAAPRFRRLTATRKEAEAIAALAASRDLRAHTAFDFDATRDFVLADRLRPYRIVHLATHGMIDTHTPALSGLVLSLFDARGVPRQGFLRLHDVYSMRLDAELVVLSGCRTALGTEMRGEGLWGLTRGFFSAGARQVMASLWQVEDQASAELMSRFYRGLLLEDKAPVAALRAAKLSLRQERRWRDPKYWAAFVLEGDWLQEHRNTQEVR